MSVEISELDDGLGCLIKVDGEMNSEVFFSAILARLSLPTEEYSKYIYFILDYSSLVIPDLNLSTINNIAQQSIAISESNSDVVVAITASDDMIFGIANIWKMLTNDCGWEISIYRSRKEADKWLHRVMDNKYDLTTLTYE